MIDKQIAVFTKFFGKTEKEIKEKLFTDVEGVLTPNEDYVTILLTWNEERVAKYKTKETTAYDNGFKKAQKEILSGVEEKYREAGIIKEDETVDNVVEKFESLKAIPPKKSTDEIKKHPDYLALEATIKKDYVPKTEYEKAIAEFDGKIKATEKEKKYNKVKEIALSKFNPDDYILSSDPKVRQNQINTILEKTLTQFDDVELPDDNSVVMIKEGKRLEDAHGNLIQFDNVIQNIAGSLYDKKAQPPAGSAANKNKVQSDTGGVKYNFTSTTRDGILTERNKLQSEAKTPEEKMGIAAAAQEAILNIR